MYATQNNKIQKFERGKYLPNFSHTYQILIAINPIHFLTQKHTTKNLLITKKNPKTKLLRSIKNHKKILNLAKRSELITYSC